MKKITKKQYEKAKKLLPKLEEAKTLTNQWETAMKRFPDMDVIAIEAGESGINATVLPKEKADDSKSGEAA